MFKMKNTLPSNAAPLLLLTLLSFSYFLAIQSNYDTKLKPKRRQSESSVSIVHLEGTSDQPSTEQPKAHSAEPKGQLRPLQRKVEELQVEVQKSPGHTILPQSVETPTPQTNKKPPPTQKNAEDHAQDDETGDPLLECSPAAFSVVDSLWPFGWFDTMPMIDEHFNLENTLWLWGSPGSSIGCQTRFSFCFNRTKKQPSRFCSQEPAFEANEFLSGTVGRSGKVSRTNLSQAHLPFTNKIRRQGTTIVRWKDSTNGGGLLWKYGVHGYMITPVGVLVPGDGGAARRAVDVSDFILSYGYSHNGAGATIDQGSVNILVKAFYFLTNLSLSPVLNFVAIQDDTSLTSNSTEVKPTTDNIEVEEKSVAHSVGEDRIFRITMPSDAYILRGTVVFLAIQYQHFLGAAFHYFFGYMAKVYLSGLWSKSTTIVMPAVGGPGSREYSIMKWLLEDYWPGRVVIPSQKEFVYAADEAHFLVTLSEGTIPCTNAFVRRFLLRKVIHKYRRYVDSPPQPNVPPKPQERRGGIRYVPTHDPSLAVLRLGNEEIRTALSTKIDEEWLATLPKKVAILKSVGMARHKDRSFIMTRDKAQRVFERQGFTVISDSTPMDYRLLLVNSAELIVTTWGALAAILASLSGMDRLKPDLRWILLANPGYNGEEKWGFLHPFRHGKQAGCDVYVTDQSSLLPLEKTWVKVIWFRSKSLDAELHEEHLQFTEAHCYIGTEKGLPEGVVKIWNHTEKYETQLKKQKRIQLKRALTDTEDRPGNNSAILDKDDLDEAKERGKTNSGYEIDFPSTYFPHIMPFPETKELQMRFQPNPSRALVPGVSHCYSKEGVPIVSKPKQRDVDSAEDKPRPHICYETNYFFSFG